MDDQGISQARDVLSRIPQFWHPDDDAVKITRLGGLTNLVFRVDHGGEQYVPAHSRQGHRGIHQPRKRGAGGARGGEGRGQSRMCCTSIRRPA